MVTPHVMPAGRGPAVLELLELDSLPCGCVAAAYRARSWDLAVVSIEAKGPHCVHAGHAQGHLLEMGTMTDLVAKDEGE